MLGMSINNILGKPLVPPLHLRKNLQLLLGLLFERSRLSPFIRRSVRIFFAVAFDELHRLRQAAWDGGSVNFAGAALKACKARALQRTEADGDAALLLCTLGEIRR
jgi:hypothetical protein